MSHPIAQVARWSSRSAEEPADSPPTDMAALRVHLALCRHPQSRALRLRSAAHGFGALKVARVISALLVSAALLALLLR
jgi:hypothetical protein